MSDNTGRARGSLRPVIYFEAPNGYIILAPVEIGHGTEVAKRMYEERYKAQGWRWCESGTSWSDVTKLQKRLQEQELKEAQARGANMMAAYDISRRKTASDLRQRMASSDCSPWERDFIAAYLDLSEEKRKKYEGVWDQHHAYLWALEMDAKTKIEDRMPSQEGDRWKHPDLSVR
jgi:hypothetical protein